MSKLGLRISTAERSAFFQLPEDEANRYFSIIIRVLTTKLDRGGVEAKYAAHEIFAQEEREPQKMSNLGERVTGFVYMKCEHCGAIHGTNIRIEREQYRCPDCRGLTPFIDLRDLEVSCECGKNFHYKTNLRDPMFDIPCLACGSPVAVSYNEKKGVYQTIRR